MGIYKYVMRISRMSLIVSLNSSVIALITITPSLPGKPYAALYE